ncbi:MAG: hypothetical protein SGPRY_005209 [Prymnesium sp.]
MAAQAGTYDSRKYECCAPYHGEVGEEFTRRFRPEFEGALHSYVDNFASLYENVVLQTDPGSGYDPAPAGAKKSFGLIRRHVEDPTMRDEIDQRAMGDGPAAWEIIVQLGTVAQTYLNLAVQDQEWMGCHITEVGFTDRTIENFNALLHRINRERPVAQQKTNVELWQKLLQSIASAGNMELQTIVRNELQDQSKVHPAGHALAGQPNLPEYVLYFSERWRSLLRDGIIKPMAPRKRAPPSGNRVDAMLTSPTATPPVLSASATFSSSFTIRPVAPLNVSVGTVRDSATCEMMKVVKLSAHLQSGPGPINTASPLWK